MLDRIRGGPSTSLTVHIDLFTVCWYPDISTLKLAMMFTPEEFIRDGLYINMS